MVATGTTNCLGDLSKIHESSSDRKDDWTALREEVTKSKRIAIVGGGIVGAESAGEILHKHKEQFKSGERTLHLIHSGPSLINSNENP